MEENQVMLEKLINELKILEDNFTEIEQQNEKTYARRRIKPDDDGLKK